MNNDEMNNEETVGLNIQIPGTLNWKLKEKAAQRKITKEGLVLLILQEAVD